ncbi:MAG: hypothetical protein NW241_22595 [Bacteroidia bacterium]|nr:hypothetical protein [Bacteroidia bacterium]
MPTVKELRRTSQFTEALALAQEQLNEQPESLYHKRQLAWVYYDMAKAAAAEGNVDAVETHIDQILALELSGEGVLSNALGYVFYRSIRNLMEQRPIPKARVVKMLETARRFDYDLTADPKPYANLLRIALKIKDYYEGFAEFIEWWDLDKLFSPEFEVYQEKSGKPIAAIAEQAYASYAARLEEMAWQNHPDAADKIDRLAHKLSDMVAQNPRLGVLSYIKARLLLSVGRGGEAIRDLVYHTKRKPNDYGMWAALGQAFEQQQDFKKAITCYGRALVIRNRPEAQVRVKERIGRLLAQVGLYVEARTEFEDIYQLYRQAGVDQLPSVLEAQQTDWYADTEPRQHNRGLYFACAREAGEILYGNVPEQIAVVTSIDMQRGRTYFRINREVTGMLTRDLLFDRTQPGDLLSVRVKAGGYGGQIRVLTARKADPGARSELLRRFEGMLLINRGQNFGFVNREIFVAEQLIQGARLVNGQNILGLAVEEFNPKRNTWGWKAVRIFD